MSKRGDPNPKKAASELTKEVWMVQTEDGKVIDRYRSKSLAEKLRKYYEKIYFIKLFLVRDNSYRENLKRSLTKK